ncbi:FG-GAP repeat protein [Streptomyces albicerus]|uniref:FG-GAP repeat protein n=1 Tax=Streptomyces albicerus TaxID=2569859 RepID=UPI001788A7DC|nr:hypothetical protein [Streptomyces albicerus]
MALAESGAKVGGQVIVVPGTSTGFTTTGMTMIHQDTTGVPGAAEAGDAMGWSVSADDYNLDDYADVLTGLPNEDITRSGANQSNAGLALLLKGTSAGLTGSGALSYNQDTSGITGWTEANDKLRLLRPPHPGHPRGLPPRPDLDPVTGNRTPAAT